MRLVLSILCILTLSTQANAFYNFGDYNNFHRGDHRGNYGRHDHYNRGHHRDRVGRHGSSNVREFVFPMNGKRYVGQNQRIYLKRLLKRNYPKFYRAVEKGKVKIKLMNVRMRAMSDRGRGQAALYVDGREQGRARINRGHRGHVPDVFLRNYDVNNSRGAWQIRLDGRINVRKVILTAKVVRKNGGSHHRHPRRDDRYDRHRGHYDTYNSQQICFGRVCIDVGNL